jgi:hypothetical protein
MEIDEKTKLYHCISITNQICDILIYNHINHNPFRYKSLYEPLKEFSRYDCMSLTKVVNKFDNLKKIYSTIDKIE